MDTGPLYLEPRLAPRLAALLGSAPFLHMLVDALGSPLNVLLPDQAAENAEGFRSVYRRHRLGGHVFFAHKANRSRSLVRRLTTADAAVDVASSASSGTPWATVSPRTASWRPAPRIRRSSGSPRGRGSP